MSNLKIGTAKVCISPPAEAFPYPGPPYLGDGITIDGIYWDVYVRVIAMSNGEETFLFGSFEESNGTDALKEAVEARYGIPCRNQMFCQIHNHGGFQTTTVTKSGRGQKKNHKYSEIQVKMGQMIFDRALEAVGQALENLQEARWGFGTGTSYLNVNRDYPMDDGYFSQADYYDGASDKTLSVMKFTDLEGNVIAAVLNYCCHANATIGATDADGKMKVSGDFPGFACGYLEKKYPGAVVMWTSGAAGNLNPLLSHGLQYEYPDGYTTQVQYPDGTGYMQMEYMGRLHGVDCCKGLDAITRYSENMPIAHMVKDVPLPTLECVEPWPPRTFTDIRNGGNGLRDYNKYPYGHLPAPGRVPEMHPGKPRIMNLHLLKLGNIALLFANAEIFSQIGEAMKAASPMKNTVIVTHHYGPKCHYIFDKTSKDVRLPMAYGGVAPGEADDIIVEHEIQLFDEILETEQASKAPAAF